uniref:Uncharacterized protein n=1 Tax=Xiphophorus maculatus TaxID=8083 RepID=A0A3B5QD22_XIPMA
VSLFVCCISFGGVFFFVCVSLFVCCISFGGVFFFVCVSLFVCCILFAFCLPHLICARVFFFVCMFSLLLRICTCRPPYFCNVNYLKIIFFKKQLFLCIQT